MLLIKTLPGRRCYNNSEEFVFFCESVSKSGPDVEEASDTFEGLTSSVTRPAMTQTPLKMVTRLARMIKKEIMKVILSAPLSQRALRGSDMMSHQISQQGNRQGRKDWRDTAMCPF